MLYNYYTFVVLALVSPNYAAAESTSFYYII